MTPAPLALAALALFVCACADSEDYRSEPRKTRAYGILKTNNDPPLLALLDKDMMPHTQGQGLVPADCLYEGHWFNDGSVVNTREHCLRCVCKRGALSCRRRACAALPDPLPRRCHVRHRRGACCPELHCADGVKLMEQTAVSRFEDADAYMEVSVPSSSQHACVEGGSVFAAGSAMGSRVACEQCFCLRGAKRCVAPTCLPPPPHCAPRPAPGVCCPQRYYCDRDTTEEPNQDKNKHDCLVEGEWVAEGEAVPGGANCTACFCLRGAVRCQAMSCAPVLAGCRPLKAPGDCCAHQYICDHNSSKGYPKSYFSPQSGNSLTSTVIDHRSFHSSKSTRFESTTTKILTNEYTLKDIPNTLATKNQHITTTKVKRKTDEPPQNTSSTMSTTTTTTTTEKSLNDDKFILDVLEEEEVSDSEVTPKPIDNNTEQPEGTVKIMINGTINCTAELSSTSLPLSITNETHKMQFEAIPRVPIVNIEAQTYSPNDIITDRNVNGGFDERDTFTINVTSSLMTNTSHSTVRPTMTVTRTTKITPTPVKLEETLNSSKIIKDDYDFDYTEPTLPPSLPNLKIIPFVAADAVVEEKPTKETLRYPLTERVDKYPVYYPSANAKDTAFPTVREDSYEPTQYPVFVSKISGQESAYPAIDNDEIDINSNRYPIQNDLGIHEYTVSTSMGHVPDVKAVTKVPAETTSSAVELNRPAVNLFSPPVETEGGFVPKGPGILDEYFGIYPSTPSGSAVPHLTTSMQLDSGDCVTEDGRQVAEGGSASVGCLQCTCAWGALRCVPLDCVAPPHCERVPLHEHSLDRCCGDLICDTDEDIPSTVPSPLVPVTIEDSREKNDINNETLEVLPLNVGFSANQTDTDDSRTNEVTTQKTSETNLTSSTISVTKPPQTNMDSITNTTTAAPTSTITTTTAKAIAKLTTTTLAPKPEVNDTSQEYEDEDDDDGFSFGSVLKLLLSDNYESTTAAPLKRPSVKPTSPPTTTTKRPHTVAPFIPLPPHPYIPSKKAPSTVNRIDHLVLGEATAIKRTTPRPITNKTTKLTKLMTTTERRSDVTIAESAPFTSSTHEGPRPPNLGGLPGVGSGLLKLAGCNIYGRMYRVGRIITELSTPCQECWCMEVGVQCKPLGC